MDTAHTYAEKVTRKAIADVVGVVPTAVGNAVLRGSFPAAWFVALRDAGLNPPEHLFAWKGVHERTPSTNGDGSLACPDDVVTPPTDFKGDAA